MGRCSRPSAGHSFGLTPLTGSEAWVGQRSLMCLRNWVCLFRDSYQLRSSPKYCCRELWQKQTRCLQITLSPHVRFQQDQMGTWVFAYWQLRWHVIVAAALQREQVQAMRS